MKVEMLEVVGWHVGVVYGYASWHGTNTEF